MAGAFTAKEVFLIPSIAWDTSLTIAPSRECLKIKRLKKETMLPEDIPDTLYLGVNGREELRIAARDEDGRLNWVKPDDYTCNLNGGDCVEVYKFAYGLKLLGLKAASSPIRLTVTLKDNPQISTSVLISVEAPQSLWLVDDIHWCLDIRRRQLVDSMPYRHFSVEKVRLNRLCVMPSGSRSFRVLGLYRDGTYAWLNNSEVRLTLSDAEYVDLGTSFPASVLISIGAGAPYNAAVTLTVTSIMDPEVQCSADIIVRSSHEAPVLPSDVPENAVAALVTAYKDDLPLTEMRSLNGYIERGVYDLHFGCKFMEMYSVESGEYNDEVLLLYANSEHREDFVTLLRSACRYCGMEYVIFIEGGRAYKLYPSGEMRLLGDCPLTLGNLEKQYSAYRGTALRCGDIWTKIHNHNWFTVLASGNRGDKNSGLKRLHRDSVNYYQNVIRLNHPAVKADGS